MVAEQLYWRKVLCCCVHFTSLWVHIAIMKTWAKTIRTGILSYLLTAKELLFFQATKPSVFVLKASFNKKNGGYFNVSTPDKVAKTKKKKDFSTIRYVGKIGDKYLTKFKIHFKASVTLLLQTQLKVRIMCTKIN